MTFDKIVEFKIAGLPQDETVKSIGFKNREIVDEFKAKGIVVSRYLVNQMIEIRGFKKRSLQKSLPLADVENRNEQFLKIEQFINDSIATKTPIFSIDTKAKELLGEFYRKGALYSSTYRKALDHDFKFSSKGILIPHGIYDIAMNIGYLSLGNSKDTAEFVCDNFFHHWTLLIKKYYPTAKSIVILCDGGGSNSSRHRIFKQQLMCLAKMLNLDIRIVHYPPYCSKYNLIEHRLFSQITRGWEGKKLLTADYACDLANKVTTKTGLKVIAEINDFDYQTREVSPDFDEQSKKFIFHDNDLPKWNYLVKCNA